MSGFEKWQAVNGVITNILLLGTLLGAWLFGFKQTEIAQKQTEINQKLLDLEYELSVDLEYDKERKVFILSNRGRHSIYFGGVRFAGSGPLEPSPHQIAVGGKQEIRRHQDYDELTPAEGGYSEDVSFYLMDERRETYIVRAEVSTRSQGGRVVTLNIRKGAPEKANW